MLQIVLSLAAVLFGLFASPPTPLARLDGITVAAEIMSTGFDTPLQLVSPPGDPRLFVVEKTGRIRIVGQWAPFLNIRDRISPNTNSEQGLLGLAFHPDFARNQRFFVYFTDLVGAITIAEGNASDPAALSVLMTVPHDQADNHNGGYLGFGPDGLLYIGTGDGGGQGDPSDNSQNPNRLLGKILRIDVSQTPYAIPASNPFATGGGAPEIFALGLRNPWRASFDGDNLYIGDVGQSDYEEVNVLTPRDAGANLGWNLVEGTTCFRTPNCNQQGLTPPVHLYDHGEGGCSVTGGHVYRGTAMPALQGRYLYSDFCSGTLMSFRLQDGKATEITRIADGLASLGQVTSLGQDAAGEVYMLTIDGTLAKLVPGPDQTP